MYNITVKILMRLTEIMNNQKPYKVIKFFIKN